MSLSVDFRTRHIYGLKISSADRSVTLTSAAESNIAFISVMLYCCVLEVVLDQFISIR